MNLRKSEVNRCLLYSKKLDNIQMWESEKSKEKNQKGSRELLVKLLITLGNWLLLVNSIWVCPESFNWKKKIGEAVQKINRLMSVVNRLIGLTVLFRKKNLKRKRRMLKIIKLVTELKLLIKIWFKDTLAKGIRLMVIATCKMLINLKTSCFRTIHILQNT